MAKEGQLLREPGQRRSGLVPELWEDTTPPQTEQEGGTVAAGLGNGDRDGALGDGRPGMREALN